VHVALTFYLFFPTLPPHVALTFRHTYIAFLLFIV
jgi:hypothetical protein